MICIFAFNFIFCALFQLLIISILNLPLAKLSYLKQIVFIFLNNLLNQRRM